MDLKGIGFFNKPETSSMSLRGFGDKIWNFAGLCKENIEESRSDTPKMIASPLSNPKTGQKAGTKAQKTGASADVRRQTTRCCYGWRVLGPPHTSAFFMRCVAFRYDPSRCVWRTARRVRRAARSGSRTSAVRLDAVRCVSLRFWCGAVRYDAYRRSWHCLWVCIAIFASIWVASGFMGLTVG